MLSVNRPIRICCTAIPQHSRRRPTPRGLCKILMEMRNLRDALDHILDAVWRHELVGLGIELAKVRTSSQSAPAAGSSSVIIAVPMSNQVVVIGGGVMGSALASWPRCAQPPDDCSTGAG